MCERLPIINQFCHFGKLFTPRLSQGARGRLVLLSNYPSSTKTSVKSFFSLLLLLLPHRLNNENECNHPIALQMWRLCVTERILFPRFAWPYTNTSLQVTIVISSYAFWKEGETEEENVEKKFNILSGWFRTTYIIVRFVRWKMTEIYLPLLLLLLPLRLSFFSLSPRT